MRRLRGLYLATLVDLALVCIGRPTFFNYRSDVRYHIANSQGNRVFAVVLEDDDFCERLGVRLSDVDVPTSGSSSDPSTCPDADLNLDDYLPLTSTPCATSCLCGRRP